MNIFQTENISELGFIAKDDILKYVSEEDIFEIVFGYKPKAYDYVRTPFREDKNPNCYFEYNFDGRLAFVDFTSQITYRGKKLIRFDCFDVIKYYFNLPNLYQVLRYIKSVLIDGKNLIPREYHKIETNKKKRVDTEIAVKTRDFNLVDKAFWFDRYQITKESLIDDKVFPVEFYKITSQKTPGKIFKARALIYCYSEFEDDVVKLYIPYRKKVRFITNCTQNDIGGVKKLPKSGKKLIITKSYKDYRVLKNQGLDVVWFQNEGMYPDLEILLPLCNRFQTTTILFDNDSVGIGASGTLYDILNSYLPGRIFESRIPVTGKKIKDPSDFIEVFGRTKLLQFLNKESLL